MNTHAQTPKNIVGPTHIHTILLKCIKVVLGLRSTETCVYVFMHAGACVYTNVDAYLHVCMQRL